ncbi:chemotaxis protein CheA [Shewanella holmiensis]|uniref:Chemotaxis protein CheA n=1 Tax=Shewanella holmiensis TaxID=2952222 RepID=A0A9X2WLB2_9GAMM|nr:chemotaxis protein CheA [Shewanella holmiensis]MCT7941363.1 chemotaxis protein CheA [Shewanella holmiensis]
MDIDLSQFSQVFFEESLEGLSKMESELLAIDIENFDQESINTIFRAAHSIKGGSATFGFTEVANFTHLLETLLDEIREHIRPMQPQHVEMLLASVDVIRNMIDALMKDQACNDPAFAPLMKRFEQTLAQPSNANISVETDTLNEPQSSPSSTVSETGLDPDLTLWQIDFSAGEDILRCGNDPIYMFTELAELGQLKVTLKDVAYPDVDEYEAEICYLQWQLLLLTDTSISRIKEVFEWVESECDIQFNQLERTPETDAQFLSPLDAKAPEEANNQDAVKEDSFVITDAPAPTLTEPQSAAEPANSFDMTSALAEAFEQQNHPSAQALPIEQTTVNTADVQAQIEVNELQISNTTTFTSTSEQSNKSVVTKPSSRSTDINQSSIRVNIEKVDQLINMVGELVITQAMLGQIGQQETINQETLITLRLGLEQLASHTRELQENVMQIRMMPISFAFNRFPRLVHDISLQLGKKVDLVLSGEETELDKTVMEKIVDPLVHLVRNSLDHGIELPEKRREQGKPELGTIQLNAFHRGGNIIIEIIDDGSGLNTDKILSIARKKGLVADNEHLNTEEIHQLIFKPGFSTAENVSGLSGRGVGMDVVKRNITELNGDINLASTPGKGSHITIRLPLTLAILDGQLVRVGNHVYVVPLMSIHESLQVSERQINFLGKDQQGHRQEVIHLREEFIPIVKVFEQFNHQADAQKIEKGIVMIVDCNNKKVGLLVDELLSQQQVVIKNLEVNYTKTPGISGATILGNGEVALIIDVISLTHLSGIGHHKEHAA